MGSQAQDARHEEMMQKAKDAVFHLEREVEAKKRELKELEEKLEAAQRNLRFHEAIDRDRD